LIAGGAICEEPASGAVAVVGMANESKSCVVNPDGSGDVVAQVSNLLYRRLPACKLSQTPPAHEFEGDADWEIGDTAD
jgi:hypothetical protein